MSIGSEKNFGRMALKTLAFYMFTTFAAIFVGLVVINLIRPGNVDLETAQNIIGRAQAINTDALVPTHSHTEHIAHTLLQLLPPNIIYAASDDNQLLGLIVFSLIFGFFISKVPHPQRECQRLFWESIQSVMMRITDMIILSAPLGVFALVMPVFMRTGLEVFKPLMLFFTTVMVALAIFFFVVMGLLLRYVGKVDPIEHMRAMLPVLMTAFSTASSASALPVALESVEKESGVSNRLASFILPLGTTINMAGTALYECSVVIFIGQIYGVLNGTTLTWVDQIIVLMLSLMTSFGVAGIPAGSLVAITMILGMIGLPVEAVGIVWVTDRILDMCRTCVNVYTNTCGAVIIARSEGEKTLYPVK
jgi:Na+/H+-dicarboxylate symporter